MKQFVRSCSREMNRLQDAIDPPVRLRMAKNVPNKRYYARIAFFARGYQSFGWEDRHAGGCGYTNSITDSRYVRIELPSISAGSKVRTVLSRRSSLSACGVSIVANSTSGAAL